MAGSVQCRLVEATAKKLGEGGRPVGQFSVTYENCAHLAAGILGRLHGGNLKTHRSAGLRDQISRTYLADVNAVRKPFQLDQLA